METVLKFDRVVLAKELNERFRQVGEVYEVASVLDNSFVLRDTRKRVAVGVVSFEDFERCFAKEEKLKGWTPWTHMVGYDGQNDILYRTNFKRVQVKFVTDKVKSEPCCHREDEFNLFFGIQIAYTRCLNKALLKQKAKYEEQLKKINEEILENNNVIKRMVDSL